MPQRIPRHARRWISAHPFVLLAYIAVAVSIIAILVAVGAQQTAGKIKRGQVESCKQVGEPVRRAVVGIEQDQIAQNHNPQLRRVFSSVPKPLLRQLIAAADARIEKRIAPLVHAPSCDDRFGG